MSSKKELEFSKVDDTSFVAQIKFQEKVENITEQTGRVTPMKKIVIVIIVVLLILCLKSGVFIKISQDDNPNKEKKIEKGTKHTKNNNKNETNESKTNNLSKKNKKMKKNTQKSSNKSKRRKPQKMNKTNKIAQNQTSEEIEIEIALEAIEKFEIKIKKIARTKTRMARYNKFLKRKATRAICCFLAKERIKATKKTKMLKCANYYCGNRRMMWRKRY